MSIRFVRRDSQGVLIGTGTTTDAVGFAHMQMTRPGEFFALSDAEPTPTVPSIPKPVLPQPPRNNYPSVEELTDALLKHLDGDVSAFAAIRAKLNK